MKKFLLAFLASVALSSTIAYAADPQVVQLTPGNTMVLRDEVSDESVGPLIIELMVNPSSEIILYINSPGGSILAGNQLINAIRASGKKVICVADFAASMAFSILQACHVRYTVPGSIIMQHQASYGARGSITQVRTQVALVEKLAHELNEHDAERLGMPVAKFQELIHDEWWLFDDESVQYKAADKQVLARCSAALANKKEVQVVESLFGSLTLVWSGCPLVTYPLSVKIERKKDADLRDFNEWAQSLDLDKDWKTRKALGK